MKNFYNYEFYIFEIRLFTRLFTLSEIVSHTLQIIFSHTSHVVLTFAVAITIIVMFNKETL